MTLSAPPLSLRLDPAALISIRRPVPGYRLAFVSIPRLLETCLAISVGPSFRTAPPLVFDNDAFCESFLSPDEIGIVNGFKALKKQVEWIAGRYAVKQLAICVVSCLAAEALFTKMRGRSLPLKDCSALVTGVILALSLPGPAPWYVGVIASFVAIGIGKAIFGGIGMNIFNPAMVGRAFVMIAFASALAASVSGKRASGSSRATSRIAKHSMTEPRAIA